MVLDTGNMDGDQLSQSQGHLALTVWMMTYEVVSCLDEDDSVLLEPYWFILNTFKNEFESLTRLSFLLSFSIRGACTYAYWTYSNILSIV